jgi:hypothetical protein
MEYEMLFLSIPICKWHHNFDEKGRWQLLEYGQFVEIEFTHNWSW